MVLELPLSLQSQECLGSLTVLQPPPCFSHLVILDTHDHMSVFLGRLRKCGSKLRKLSLIHCLFLLKANVLLFALCLCSVFIFHHSLKPKPNSSLTAQKFSFQNNQIQQGLQKQRLETSQKDSGFSLPLVDSSLVGFPFPHQEVPFVPSLGCLLSAPCLKLLHDKTVQC